MDVPAQLLFLGMFPFCFMRVISCILSSAVGCMPIYSLCMCFCIWLYVSPANLISSIYFAFKCDRRESIAILVTFVSYLVCLISVNKLYYWKQNLPFCSDQTKNVLIGKAHFIEAIPWVSLKLKCTDSKFFYVQSGWNVFKKLYFLSFLLHYQWNERLLLIV